MNTYRYINQVQRDAMAYSRAKPFLDEMKAYRGLLTDRQMRELKDRALDGDITGASKELARALRNVRYGGI